MISKIYQDLSEIKTNTISTAGKEFQRLINNRSIKGFLQQTELKEQLKQKIINNDISAYNQQNTNPKGKSVNEQLSKHYKKSIEKANSDIWSHKIHEKNMQMKYNFNMFLEHHYERMKNEKMKKEQQQEIEEDYYKKNVVYIQQQRIKNIMEMKNKSPSNWKYNPNYDAIFPHIPYAKLPPMKDSGKDQKQKQKQKIEKSWMFNRLKLRKVQSSNSIEWNWNNSVPVKDSLKSTVKLKTSKSDRNKKKSNKNKSWEIGDELKMSRSNSHTKRWKTQKSSSSIINYSLQSASTSQAIALEKNSARKLSLLKKENNDSVWEPNKLFRKVSAPNFNKMMSREKKVAKLTRFPSIADYSPNYNWLYHNERGYDKGDLRTYKKKVKMRKLWTSFVVRPEYTIISKMNIID